MRTNFGTVKNSENSEENTYARVSFLKKLQAGGSQLYEIKAPVRVFFCEFWKI